MVRRTIRCNDITELRAGLQRYASALSYMRRVLGQGSEALPDDPLRFVATQFIKDLEFYIAAATLDGNYDGTLPPRITPIYHQDNITVIWEGEQIVFVEFGTGAKGAASGYGDPARMGEYRGGYEPDPAKEYWFYHDKRSGELVKSHGLPAQSPWLKAIERWESAPLAFAFLVGESAMEVVTNAFDRA